MWGYYGWDSWPQCEYPDDYYTESPQNDYYEYTWNSYTKPVENTRWYTLGIGWHFNFPSMEMYKPDPNSSEEIWFLHSENGTTYKADWNTISGIEKYKLKDMILRKDTSYTSHVEGCSSYSLTLKNGIVYYFGSDGRLLAIRDRYGNEITFYNNPEEKQVSYIVDSVGRKIHFTRSDNTITLTIRDVDDTPIPGSIKYDMADNNQCGQRLDAVTDMANRVTRYTYQEIEAKFAYTNTVTYPDITYYNEASNYYLALCQITHPIGNGQGKTIYVWETPLPTKTLTGDKEAADWQQYIRIKERYESIVGDPIRYGNKSYQYTDNGNGTSRSTEETYSENGSSIVEQNYDSENRLTSLMVISDGVTKKQEYSYDEYDRPTSDRVTYDNGTTWFETMMAYDEYKNVTYVTDTVGRTNYLVYDNDNYSTMINKRERIGIQKSEDRYQQTEYTLTADGKNIERLVEKLVVYDASESDIRTSSSGALNAYGTSTWMWKPTDAEFEAEQFNFTIYWFAAAPCQAVDYEIQYRRVSETEWTMGYENNYTLQGALFASHSGQHYIQLNMPESGQWEVMVKAVGGYGWLFGSNITVTSAVAHGRKIKWLTSSANVTRQTVYEYYTEGPSAGLMSMEVAAIKINENGSVDSARETGYFYDTKYNAYPSRIEEYIEQYSVYLQTALTYDAYGRIIKMYKEGPATDCSNYPQVGYYTNYEYDLLGRLTKVTEPLVIEEDDWKQYVREIVYMDGDSLTPTPSVRLITRDIADAQAMSPYEDVLITYDALGRRTGTQKKINGSPKTLEMMRYNSLGLIEALTMKNDDGQDVVTSYVYDAGGRLKKTIYGENQCNSPRNYVEHTYYDQIAPTVIIIDSNGHPITYHYDMGGRLVSAEESVTELVNPGSTQIKQYVTSYTYDLLGQVLSVKDPKNQVTTYEYGNAGLPQKIVMPGSSYSQQEFTYNNQGWMTRANYGNGDITYSYDNLGRVISVKYPATNLTPEQRVEFEYLLFEESWCNGEERRAILKQKQGDKFVIVNEVITNHDFLGNLKWECWVIPGEQGSYYSITYKHDGAGNTTSITYPGDGNSVNYVYANWLTPGQIINIPGIVDSIEYTANGFLKKLSFANGAITAITPDARYRIGRITTTLGATTFLDEQYAYDYSNNVIRINNQTQYYDELNRLRVANIPTPNGVKQYEYGYDAAGNRTFEMHSGVTKQYAFDAVTKGNAVTSITRNGINIDSYSYGNAGEMKGMVYGRDNKETMPMNPASSGYTDDAQSGPATWESNAGIDRRGLNEASRYYADMPYRVNLKQFTGLRPNTIYTFSAWIKDKPETSFPNNSMCIGSNEIYPSNTWQLYSVEVVSDNSGSLSVGFGTLSGWGIDVLITEVSLYQSNNEIKPYDPATSGYTIYEQSGSAIWESNAGNDRRGLNEASRYYSNLPYSRINKKQFTGLKPNTAYTFSAWIKESPGTIYPGYPMRLGLNGCDGINNPIGNYIVIYPEDNWKRFSYECVSDGNGSLAIGFGVWGEIDVLITEVTLVESDVEVEYAYDGAGRLGRVRNDAAGIVVEYIYDGYGRLIKEIEQCPDGMVRSTIRLPMGNQTAYEKISEGTDTITRVYIPFGGKTIAKRESVNGGQAEVSFYHTDNLGSIRGVSGADSATFQYDPYGNTISGEQSEHNLGFTGKPHDSTGLYYFGARFYDPELGRFITVDPARDGLNWYVYCYGNPLKYVDPDGRQVEVLIGDSYKLGSVTHAAIRITNDTGDWVYSFGRYDKGGALIKIKADDYLYGKPDHDIVGQDDYRDTNGFVLNITSEQEVMIQQYLDGFFADKGQVQIVKDRYYKIEGMDELKYSFLGRNVCTTIVANSLRAGGVNVPASAEFYPHAMQFWLLKFSCLVTKKYVYPKESN